MKDIRDYLHLYLGCEVYDENPKDEKFRRYVLTGKELGYYEHRLHTIKPILRRLSSMTEDQAIHLAKLSEWENHFREVRVERNSFNDRIITWQGANESRESFNATGELFYCADQFQWLLKMGFDLFRLIGDGLAIDAETIK